MEHLHSALSSKLMTGRQRLAAALRGEPVDRPPIWLREGFDIVGGPAEAGDFTNGWQADRLYRDLFAEIAPHCDDFVGWGVPCFNRLLMAPTHLIRWEPVEAGPDLRAQRAVVTTPRGELTQVSHTRRGVATGWIIKHLVETPEELKKLAELDFTIHQRDIDAALAGYRRAAATVGDRGLPRLFLSSPIVCISGAMPFEMFLEMSAADRPWLHELCRMVMDRTLSVLERLFATGPMDTVVTLGGSEQCTPPMMAPAMFDEFVVPYDGPIFDLLKRQGCLTTLHCHGRVRHALRGMLAMGIDGTDPVEPPPAGDVTFAEARAICGDKLTIMGNLEWDELEFSEPARIRHRVGEMLSDCPRRLILGASAGPISAITPQLAANYRAWIQTALGMFPNG